MEPYFIKQGHQLSSTRLFLNEPFPQLYDFDWLIVMGGPMGVTDELQYPWMSKEKLFIKSSIESGKIVLRTGMIHTVPKVQLFRRRPR